MRYPKNLQPGKTIGFVAPSFGCQIEPYRSGFENAQKKFREMGYGLDLGPNCYMREGVGISNTPGKCAAELMAYYLSNENDCLISCGGGELMCEILGHMDFDRIRSAAPKWYMGYSDNTNMTYLLATLCDTASIYGPCAATFGMEPWHPSLQDALGLLAGKRDAVKGYDRWERESLKNEENPLAPYHVTEEKILKCYVGSREVCWEDSPGGREEHSGGREEHSGDWEAHSGGREAGVHNWADFPGQEGESRLETDGVLTFQGRLLGGCMDCLVNLLGTRFDRTAEFLEKYKEDGIIWFLEACDLNVFAIRRAMWQMEEAGWFRYVKGFLIGRPLCFGQEMMGLDAYHAVLEVAGRRNVPVVMDVDLGHLPPMMPLIVGSMGTVSVRQNDITVLMERR